MKNVATKIGESRIINFANTHKKEIALIVCGGITGVVIHKKLMPNDVKCAMDMFCKCRKGSRNIYGIQHKFAPNITIKDLELLSEEILSVNNTPATPDTIVTGVMVTVFTK